MFVITDNIMKLPVIVDVFAIAIVIAISMTPRARTG